MDFVEGLPASDRYNAILVIVDKFSKYGHFIPLHHPYTAIQIAKLLLDHVYLGSLASRALLNKFLHRVFQFGPSKQSSNPSVSWSDT